jgi:hypothetical protein
LRGLQQPRICQVPEYASTAGDEAIEVYELAGGSMDPWQQLVLRDSMGERPDGRWAAFEVGLVVARQNGKDEILCARELWGLFIGGERLLIHSAHKFDTAMEHLERLVGLIENVPEFSRRVKKINRSHGQEGITLRGGARIRFRARTRSGGGRGYTGDCVIFNEAMELPDEIVGSIMPTMSARSMLRPGPQIWIAGSAVDQTTMSNGLVLARVREAGVAGGNDRLAYFEHSSDVEGWLEAHGLRFDSRRPEVEQVTAAMLADTEMWAQANPALGYRISVEHVGTELRSPSMSPRQFAVERLGIGDWPDTSEDGGRVVGREAWAAIAERDQANRITGRPTFAVDASPDHAWAALAVAGGREDDLDQFAVVEHERGMDWIVELCAQHQARNKRSVFVVDGKGPAASLIDDLKAAGVRVLVASTEDYGNACGQFADAVAAGQVRYPYPQPELDDALAGARMATLGDRWKWGRRTSTGSDITTLVAVTLALWGHMRKPAASRVINPYDYV